MNAAIYEVNFRYIGRSWFNCGPTAGQSGALTTDQNFSKTLGAAYNQVFSENQGLMQNLTGNLQGIINAGPSQQGFSPQELAAQNSQAINAAAASNQKVQQEIGVNAAKGTANPGVESGITQAERSSAATTVDTNLSNTAANITNADYTTGRQNYFSAVGAQEAAPGAFENPANQAGSVASGANQVTDTQANANAADSTGNELLGLGEGLAADAGTALGCVTPDTSIVMANGEEVRAGDLKIGDRVHGLTTEDKIVNLVLSLQPAVRITMLGGTEITVSESHTFALLDGGYVLAADSLGASLKVRDWASSVKSVEPVGKVAVIKICLTGSHAYVSNGIWSLE